MRVIALTERLTGYGCQDVFIIRTDLDTNGSIIGDGRPVNLLLDPDSVSLSMIRASNHTSSEDLDWSGTLIFNSSETSLRDQVTERLTTVPADERGGPLFFKLMMGIVTSTLSEAIETLVDNLRKLTLKADAFPGEDIDGLNKM